MSRMGAHVIDCTTYIVEELACQHVTDADYPEVSLPPSSTELEEFMFFHDTWTEH